MSAIPGMKQVTPLKKETFYVTQSTLSGIMEKIHAYMTLKGLMDYEIVRLEIQSGLPRCDYGQTITISYREVKSTMIKLPTYKDLFKDHVLFHS